MRLLIADDHGIVRAGLAALMGAQPDIEVVGEAASVAETVQEARRLQPDVVLLDLSMPEGGGLRAARTLLSSPPHPAIVVLSVHDDAPHLRAALRSGVSAHVTKGSPDRTLLEAVRAAHAGRTYVDPALSEVVAGELMVDGRLKRAGEAPLTPRLQEVLRLVAWGYTTEQIAARLSLTAKTVEAHRARIMQRLGLTNRAELVRYAFQAGLMESAPLSAGGEP
jgi:DNA-binding NarL/FixJ family response regulator